MEESNNRELRNEKGQTLEEFLEAYDENKALGNGGYGGVHA